MEKSSIDLCYQPLFSYYNLYSKAALMNFYIFKELVQPFFDIENIIYREYYYKDRAKLTI